MNVVIKFLKTIFSGCVSRKLTWYWFFATCMLQGFLRKKFDFIHFIHASIINQKHYITDEIRSGVMRDSHNTLLL